MPCLRPYRSAPPVSGFSFAVISVTLSLTTAMHAYYFAHFLPIVHLYRTLPQACHTILWFLPHSRRSINTSCPAF